MHKKKTGMAWLICGGVIIISGLSCIPNFGATLVGLIIGGLLIKRGITIRKTLNNQPKSDATIEQNVPAKSENIESGIGQRTINMTVHPDLDGLLWIADGPMQNYSNSPKSEDSFHTKDGIEFTFSIFGTEEPSLIYINDPISKPPELPDRPPYFPTYHGLNPEQRWMYCQFLSDPYNKVINNIGYVFIFYYGLERHLISGDFDRAFDLILKLRDIYSNKSFQGYSAKALVLSAILHSRPDKAERFIASLDKDYEMQIDSDLFMLCKFSLNIQLNAFEIIKYYRFFGFENNRYIKREEDLFAETLAQKLVDRFGRPYILRSDYFKTLSSLEWKSISIFANMSLMEKQINIPVVSSNKIFLSDIRKILELTHESVKSELAERRRNIKQTSDSPKELK